VFAKRKLVRYRRAANSFDRGLKQLVEGKGPESNYFTRRDVERCDFWLPLEKLQFDVVQFRLENEYKAASQCFKVVADEHAHEWFRAVRADVSIKAPYGSRDLVTDSFGSEAIYSKRNGISEPSCVRTLP